MFDQIAEGSDVINYLASKGITAILIGEYWFRLQKEMMYQTSDGSYIAVTTVDDEYGDGNSLILEYEVNDPTTRSMGTWYPC